jgi:hypothetical protein
VHRLRNRLQAHLRSGGAPPGSPGERAARHPCAAGRRSCRVASPWAVPGPAARAIMRASSPP